MKPTTNTVYHGDCREFMASLPDHSIDAIVTDPPYELGFMGKKWDASGIAYDVDMWSQALRVLKPGGHMLAFGGTRTYHRMACAIEDAGFEIRDCIQWLYGSGFPKSLDVSKAIDKAAGAEREVIDTIRKTPSAGGANTNPGWIRPWAEGKSTMDITVPATDAAREWQGWGTALKPANEPIVVARKPLVGTVAANVLAHGTGALNINACRIGNETININTFDNGAKPFGGAIGEPYSTRSVSGRWPANVILDEDAAETLDNNAANNVSRFFYVAKPSRSERNAGTHGKAPQPASNFHPTVKPIELMRYLIRLVTSPGGIVLDPFLGSGTTACAAIIEGHDWIGSELTEDYLPIIDARIKWAQNQAKQQDLTLFE